MSDIGGQAVIEGVMMRSGNAWTVAVRNSDKEIVLKKERSRELPFIYKFLSRIALMPLIAGLSYEFIKFSSKKMNNPFVRILAMPGLWLQKLTTGVPSHDQIEVAVRALKEVLEMDEKRENTNVIG